MQNKGERIKELRQKIGLTQTRLAELIESDGNTISRWERNKASPDEKILPRLAQILNTSIDYILLGEASEAASVSALRQEDNTNPNWKMFDVIPIPVYSISACMGKGFDNEGEGIEILDTIYLPPSDVGRNYPDKVFALMAEGLSMSPVIEDGDRVVVNPNIFPTRGDICLARVMQYGYFKDSIKFYFPNGNGGCILKASEVSGVPQIEISKKEFDDGEAVIVGRVMYIDTGRKV